MTRIIFVLGSLAMMAVFVASSAHVGERAGNYAQVIQNCGLYQFPNYDKGQSSPPRATILPGRVKNLVEQCKERRSDYEKAFCAFEKPAEICAQLLCNAGRGDISINDPTGPAFDGTWCGDKKMCIRGACVNDSEPLREPLKVNESPLCVRP